MMAGATSPHADVNPPRGSGIRGGGGDVGRGMGRCLCRCLYMVWLFGVVGCCGTKVPKKLFETAC